MEETKKFIGRQQVVQANKDENEPGFVHILFDNDEIITIHEHLYDIMVTEEPVDAPNIEELKWSCIAKEFYNKLTEYNLLSYEVAGVAQYMQNYARNLHDSAVKALWGGKSQTQVELQDVKKVLSEK